MQYFLNSNIDHLSQFQNTPLFYVAVMIGLAIIPFLALSVTSFLKLSIVFAVLRNAIGAGQFPSAAISSLLAIILSLHIMSPVGKEIWHAVQTESTVQGDNAPMLDSKKRSKPTSKNDLSGFLRVGALALPPIEQFMRRHSKSRERLFFAGLGEQLNKRQKQVMDRSFLNEQGSSKSASEHPTLGSVKNNRIPGETFFTLLPAFVISELHAAFEVGISIFLPFLIVDLVVANILVGLGMMMVSPISIALPMKISLFVVCDGWFLLCRGLVISYV